MSLRPDGAYRCDKCGTPVGNAGIDQCAHITDLNPDDPADIRHFHLCNDCRTRVLTRRALADFYATRT